jgi:hypothetical protein
MEKYFRIIGAGENNAETKIPDTIVIGLDKTRSQV